MIRSILKVALPDGVVQLLRDLGRVEPGARATYLRLMWRKRGGRDPLEAVRLTRNARVVAICHGNILRSAYAELSLKQPAVAARVPGLRVSSAGLHASAGASADRRGIQVAGENGLDLSAHRTTRVDAPLVAAADLLLVMDYMNAAELLSRYPHAARKIVLLGSFDSKSGSDPAIPDPYTGDLDAVRASYARVATATEALVAKLSAL